MDGSNGRHGSLYEQTLECARREIDEASAQISRLRESLRVLEARTEAAKAVYEAVAAPLNIEDEIAEPPAEEVEAPPPQAAPRPALSEEEVSRLIQAKRQEPAAPAPSAYGSAAPPQPAKPTFASPTGPPSGLSASESDLIRRHLEARSTQAASFHPAPAPPQRTQPPRPGGLSEEDRRLIEEHLRRRMEAERQNA